MKKEITDLQKLMKEEGIDALYIPETDPHGSEDIHPRYMTCAFLSGLHAEETEMVVTADAAYIWTDGRFFIQAERELAGSGVTLMKKKEEGVPEVSDFLKEKLSSFAESCENGEFVVGFDGRAVPALTGRRLIEALSALPCVASDDSRVSLRFRTDADLAWRVWKERPEMKASGIFELPLSSAGLPYSEKIKAVRKEMSEKSADYLLLSDLAETAWLFNLRGSDITYTPVFYSYTLAGPYEVTLYVADGALDSMGGKLPASLDGVKVKDYDEVFKDVSSVPSDSRIWIDPRTANYRLWESAPCEGNIISEATPVAMAKSVKNETEQACTARAHIRDGAAVTRFIKWFKDRAKEPDADGYLIDPETGGHLTEIGAGAYIDALRQSTEGNIGLSFGTIAGYGPNGAIVHYKAGPETDLEIKAEGFLLLDSGGQYTDGTTDITRTIAAGPLTQQMIDNYTYVLKGHIDLARFVIKPDTVNSELDTVSREAVRSAGYDFSHGVGHGVGYVLGVHEGPAGVRRDDKKVIMVPGMLISDEPGIYIKDEYGIRIENVMLLKEGTEEGTTVFETLTCVPYEREAINKDLLTAEQIAWVDEYHAWVRKTLTPLLDEETAEFLKQATKPL